MHITINRKSKICVTGRLLSVARHNTASVVVSICLAFEAQHSNRAVLIIHKARADTADRLTYHG